MKHDEDCELGYWRRDYGPDYWGECYCAIRAYSNNPWPTEDRAIYPARPYDLDDLEVDY